MNKSLRLLAHGFALSALFITTPSFADLVITRTWTSQEAEAFLSENTLPSTLYHTTTTQTTQTPVVHSNTNTPKAPTVITSLPQTTSFTALPYDLSVATTPTVNARSALVIDVETGEILYQKSAKTVMPIASVTKVMTAMVTLDANLDMHQSITLVESDFAGAAGKNSSSQLKVGDRMNRAELLLSALMKSENPAAAALARTYPGGKTAFVTAMNRKAQSLNMRSSVFTEATGLDPKNRSTSDDLAKMVKTAVKYDVIRRFSTTASFDFNVRGRVVKANNTNSLVRNGGWNLQLSKTGFINEAGRCVVLHSTVNARPTIIILLNANTTEARTQDAQRLIGWVNALPRKM